MRLHNWESPGASLQSRVVGDVLAATWRPLTHVLPPGRAGALITRRLIAAFLKIGSPTAPGAVFTRVEEQVTPDLTVRGEWVRTPESTRDDAVVLYLHGSGYVICSSRTHRGLTSHVAAGTGIPVFSIDYRLAPTHPYPAAPRDVRAAWTWLVGRGYDPSRIVVAGDSAGGHLAITLSIELAREGQPLPAAVVTLSPVIDLAITAGEARDRIVHDPFAAATVARRTLMSYADEAALLDEGLRIEFDDLPSFPPILVHSGSREMLAADGTELVRRIRNAGFEVSHRVWPGQMHVFQALTAVVPESRPALAEICSFITDRLAEARPELRVVRSA